MAKTQEIEEYDMSRAEAYSDFYNLPSTSADAPEIAEPDPTVQRLPIFEASIIMSALAFIALFVNLYLLNVSSKKFIDQRWGSWPTTIFR